MDFVFPPKWLVYSFHSLWISLSVSLNQSFSDTQNTPAALNLSALVSISCLFSQYQIILGVYLLVSLPASVFLFLLFTLLSLIITFPLTFSSICLPWNKWDLCHDNAHILDHILHHLDSCSLVHPVQFSMILIITMHFFSLICRFPVPLLVPLKGLNCP